MVKLKKIIRKTALIEIIVKESQVNEQKLVLTPTSEWNF